MAKFDVDKVVEGLKPFLPEEKYKFINLCKLNKVSVKMVKAATEDDKGVPSTYEYAGIEIPNLVFEFQQIRPDGDDSERFYIHAEKPCVINKKDGGIVTDKEISGIITQMFDRILHIHKAFAKSVNYKDMKNAEVPELKETAAIADRIASYVAFFEYIAASFNSGKIPTIPIYKDDKQKSVLLWLKLVANYPDGKYLTIPGFVGKGFIEMFKLTYPHSSLTFTGKETYVIKQASQSGAKASTSGAATQSEAANEEVSADLQAIIDQAYK